MKVDPVSTQAWGELHDFQTFSDPQLEQMKRETASFIDDIRNNRTPRWLSLLGTSGAGKTMLATIIHRIYQREKHMQIDWPATERTKDKDPRIIRWRGGMINWGKAVNNRMLKGDYDFLEDVTNYSFFAIDDIASEYEKHRGLSASKLYGICEGRLKKWTVFTANLSLEQIGEVLDARIASRMLRDSGTVVDVNVPDYSLRKRAA